MESELAEQIKQLFDDNDQQSIKFILAGQKIQIIQKIYQLLPQNYSKLLKNIYQSLQKDQEYQIQDQQQRNRKFDIYLQQGQLQQKNQTFLEMISKVNQKLIYEQYFGFPFYDLCKRILITNGDLRPLQSTIKTVHSQIQILYSTLFSSEVLQWIRQNNQNLSNGFKQYLNAIFSRQCEKYFNFHRVYRRIKKQTDEQQRMDEDIDEQNRQMNINEDQTLQIDQKQFLVSLSDNVEQFQQFQKNRSYNFMCFGLKKYQLYIGLSPTIFGLIKQRQFCQLLSFLTIRFIRKIIFKIIKNKQNGKLIIMKQSIIPQEIKLVGNQLVDQISNIIEKYLAPIKSIQQDAKEIFLLEFQPYSYKDFIPRKAINQAKVFDQSLPQYVWRTCKQYKTIWSQRIKIEKYLKNGGIKPQFDFINYLQGHQQDYNNDPGKVWKDFIMIKFGFQPQRKIVTRKRMKLDSLND